VTGLVNVIVIAGMLVAIPFGLRLAGDRGARWSATWWPVAAIPGAVCLWLPRGTVAVVLAALYAAAAYGLAGLAAVRLARRRALSPAEVALLTALACPSIAATALVAERGGWHLFGFSLRILELTVPHFHFAGFAAALIAGLVCRSAPDSGLAKAAALCVPAGAALVFAGYFTGDEVELAGAAVLTVGMWAAALVTWTVVRPTATNPLTRTLFGISALTLAATMALALDYAAGEALGIPHLTLTWMAATHGVANAAGFALCGIAAWTRYQRADPLPGDAAPGRSGVDGPAPRGPRRGIRRAAPAPRP
jgi:hypothetical protein